MTAHCSFTGFSATVAADVNLLTVEPCSCRKSSHKFTSSGFAFQYTFTTQIIINKYISHGLTVHFTCQYPNKVMKKKNTRVMQTCHISEKHKYLGWILQAMYFVQVIIGCKPEIHDISFFFQQKCIKPIHS